MIKKIYLILFLAGTVLFQGCLEVFEEPVDEETVELLSPGEGYETNRNKNNERQLQIT